MGRRKIEMKMVENINSRQVIFSKRRSGLFKKASELVTLCGTEVGILTYSPGNKPFSYGHPSVDHIFDRFMRNNDTVVIDRRSNKKMQKLNQELADLQNELEIEKREGELLDRELEKKKRSRESLEVAERGRVKENLGMSKKEKEACSSLLLLSKECVKMASTF